jgi:hypothetical protein
LLKEKYGAHPYMQTGCKLLCKEGYYLDIDNENSDMFAPGYTMRYDDISFLTSNAVKEGEQIFNGDGQDTVKDITGKTWMKIAEYTLTESDQENFG